MALWGIIGVISGWDVSGSIAFCLALNFKQMELYHSLPFFCYLLGKALSSSGNRVAIVTKLGMAVIFVFGLCWIPFYIVGGKQGVIQVLMRIFPFNRGIFEDKVASFWCTISVLIKIKDLLPLSWLVRISFITTLITTIPSLGNLLKYPTAYRFLLSLVSLVKIFFIASYYTIVHLSRLYHL